MSVPDEPSVGLFHSFYRTFTNDVPRHMFSIWEVQRRKGWREGWREGLREGWRGTRGTRGFVKG